MSDKEPTGNMMSTVDIQQYDVWNSIRLSIKEESMVDPFAKDPKEEERRRALAKHKLWLESFRHECPSPYINYRIGVYIRYFNQTKYANYLEYHKQQFADTIALCPNWTLVDFYVDEGQSAPLMSSTTGWIKLMDDCMHGKVNLIITQKISNVSRNPSELIFASRLLASLKPPIGPIGIYFISEDLFTLASYYQSDMHETRFLPEGNWNKLPDDPDEQSVDGWEILNE